MQIYTVSKIDEDSFQRDLARISTPAVIDANLFDQPVQLKVNDVKLKVFPGDTVDSVLKMYFSDLEKASFGIMGSYRSRRFGMTVCMAARKYMGAYTWIIGGGCKVKASAALYDAVHAYLQSFLPTAADVLLWEDGRGGGSGLGYSKRTIRWRDEETGLYERVGDLPSCLTYEYGTLSEVHFISGDVHHRGGGRPSKILIGRDQEVSSVLFQEDGVKHCLRGPSEVTLCRGGEIILTFSLRGEEIERHIIYRGSDIPETWRTAHGLPLQEGDGVLEVVPDGAPLPAWLGPDQHYAANGNVAIGNTAPKRNDAQSNAPKESPKIEEGGGGRG